MQEIRNVFPSTAKPAKTITLSPIDNVMRKVYTRVLFFFKRDLDLDALFNSYETVLLQEFDILFGRLSQQPDGSLLVLPSCQPLPFCIVKSSTISYEELEKNGWAHSCIPLGLEPCAVLGHEFPLVQVKVTKTTDQCTVIGFGLHHSIGDGPAMIVFMKRWAEYFNQPNEEVSTMDISFDRFPLLSLLEEGGNGSVMQDLSQYRIKSESELGQGYEGGGEEEEVKIVKFTQAQLLQLKEGVMQELSKQGKWVSTNNALYAHLWRHVALAKGLPGTEKTKLGFAVNARKRLGLSENYFGNVNTYGCAELSVNELLTLSLAQVSLLLRESLDRMTPAYCCSLLKCISEQPDKSRIVTNLTVAISSWGQKDHLKFTDVCFGESDNHDKVRIPFFAWDSYVLVLEQAEKGVECFIGLTKKAWENMPNTLYL